MSDRGLLSRVDSPVLDTSLGRSDAGEEGGSVLSLSGKEGDDDRAAAMVTRKGKCSKRVSERS